MSGCSSLPYPRWLGYRRQRFRDRGFFLDRVLDLCLNQLLSQRPSCSTDSSPTFSMPCTSPKSTNISSSTCTSKYAHLNEYHIRRPCRRGLPIARFCLTLPLSEAATNFKPNVTWKRNVTAIITEISPSPYAPRGSFRQENPGV